MLSSQLDRAHDAVQAEIHELEHGVDATFEQISTSFQELIDSLERRRAQLLNQVGWERGRDGQPGEAGPAAEPGGLGEGTGRAARGGGPSCSTWWAGRGDRMGRLKWCHGV